MLVWITKYALTKGIYQIDAEGSATSTMVVGKVGGYRQCFHKNEWFESKEDAIANAEERRIKKLQSLDKQIKNVSSIKF